MGGRSSCWVAASNAASFKPWSTLAGSTETVIGAVIISEPGCTVAVDVSGSTLAGSIGTVIGAVIISEPGCTVAVVVSGSTLAGSIGTVIGPVIISEPGCTVNVDVVCLTRRFHLRKRSTTAPPTRIPVAAAPPAIATVVIEPL